MARFFCGIAVPILVMVLGSFTPPKATTPLKLSDLTMDRIVRQAVDLSSGSVSVTAPPSAGFVITSFSGGNGISALSISINGSAPPQLQTLSGCSGGTSQPAIVDPPIIVRPGDTLQISTTTGGGFCIPTTQVTLGGYVVYPGEV